MYVEVLDHARHDGGGLGRAIGFSPQDTFRGLPAHWSVLTKGGAQEIDFLKSPQIWCFGVLIALMGGAKGPYKVTALKST